MAQGVWRAMLARLRARGRWGGEDTVPVGLVLGLRDAAYGLAAVEAEIDEAERVRSGEDFTQARLFTATARLIKRCADSLTDGVSEEPGAVERWRSDSAAMLYRSAVELMEGAQEAVASPPHELRPVGTSSPLARFGMPRQAASIELLDLGQQLEDEYTAEIALVRAGRGENERRRLDELMAHLRSRTNLAESLLRRGLAGATDAAESGGGHAEFDEVLVTWMLIVQELVHANVTAGLQPGPRSVAAGRYAPENVWMMTDPVAKARYDRQGRLDDLEQDIRYSVLRGRVFSVDDVAFAQQIDWLEQSGTVKRLASYWAVSPHPPIYRALEAGQISLCGRSHRFNRGQDIVWLCQMGMEMFGADAPVLIGDLQAAPVRRLCSDMGNAIMAARAQRGRR